MLSIAGRWRWRCLTRRRRGYLRCRRGFLLGKVFGDLGRDLDGLLCLVHDPSSAAREKKSTSNPVARLVRSWEPRADVRETDYAVHPPSRAHQRPLSLIDHASGSRSTGGRAALRSRLLRAANTVNAVAKRDQAQRDNGLVPAPGCLRLRGQREDGRTRAWGPPGDGEEGGSWG